VQKGKQIDQRSEFYEKIHDLAESQGFSVKEKLWNQTDCKHVKIEGLMEES